MKGRSRCCWLTSKGAAPSGGLNPQPSFRERNDLSRWEKAVALRLLSRLIVSRRRLSPRVVLTSEGAGRFRSASQDLFVALAKAPRAAVTKSNLPTLPSRAAWSPKGRRTQGHAAKRHLAKGSRPWMDPLGLRRAFGLRDFPHGAAHCSRKVPVRSPVLHEQL